MIKPRLTTYLCRTEILMSIKKSLLLDSDETVLFSRPFRWNN
uniref:Uncharacterized protein n=1 Tax=Rhizophora mucronata TaxID=61149 RepID=A0A2P2JI42_RHIMU